MNRRFSGLALCVLMVPGTFSCVEVPGEPLFPNWDVQVSASLVKTTHSIRDMVEGIAELPPEVLDTLDLSSITLTFEETLSIGDSAASEDTTFTEEFVRDVRSARLYAEVENATPAHLAVSLEVLDRAASPVVVLPSGGTVLNLAAAPIDETGKVGPASTAVTYEDLQADQIVRLGGVETLHYIITLTFPPGVQAQNVLTADTMHIRAWGTFLTTVNP